MILNCATIFSENQYQYTISTTPSDASITVMDNNQTIATLNSPNKLTVNMKKDIVLKLEAKGYKEKYHAIEKSINGWFWWNLFLGGALGLIIDYSTGSMYKPLDEKTDLNFTLEPDQQAPTPEKKGKKVSLVN